MDADRRYQRTLALKALLGSELFQEILDGVREDVSRETFDTKPEEGLKREHLYYELKCLDRMVQRLNMLANEASDIESLVKKREEQRKHATG